MIKIFMGGRGGGLEGGVAVKDAWVEESLRDLFKNILKQGVCKSKSCS